MASYDPNTFRGVTFYDAAERFAEGTDTPRAYLERCLETIASRDGTVKAWVTYSADLGREAADASTARWKAGRPLSPIDGMPLGIKDLLETKDFPTEMGCEAFRGNFPKRDNAAVWALREAGAVILGKVTTAELGGSHPPATTNPFDPTRTAGGSSSGSAAAVGAGMVPAAIGSQVGGSIIRPAAFCANYALKPTQGAINRGERQATSQSTHGPHAASLEDMWQVAIEIAKRCGGDRGCLPLAGPDTPPAPMKPARVIVLETEGWAEIDDATRSTFETLMARLAATGVQLIRREDNPLVEALEQSIADGRRVSGSLTAFENRWMQSNLVRTHGNAVSERARAIVAKAEKMTVTDYQALLVDRHVAQQRHAAVAGIADAMITLSRPRTGLGGRQTGRAAHATPNRRLRLQCWYLDAVRAGGHDAADERRRAARGRAIRRPATRGRQDDGVCALVYLGGRASGGLKRSRTAGRYASAGGCVTIDLSAGSA